MTGNNILNFYTGLKEQSFSPNILTRKFTLFAVKFCFSINDCKIPICKLQKMHLVIRSPSNFFLSFAFRAHLSLYRNRNSQNNYIYTTVLEKNVMHRGNRDTTRISS